MNTAWMMTYIFLGLLTLASLTFSLIAVVRKTDLEELAVPNQAEDKQPNE